MKNSKEEALSSFLSDDENQELDENSKKVVLNNKEGLIERVDKILVTKDGKQLLREQY